LGNNGNDRLDGRGGNDVLFGDMPGGTAGADTFVFDGLVGQDVIGDFHHGEDKIELIGLFSSFSQLQANFVQSGSDGAINLGGGNFIVLQGVTMNTLTASDFILTNAAEPSQSSKSAPVMEALSLALEPVDAASSHAADWTLALHQTMAIA
jgi:Ca2+-binding RTX toxin-like protein